LINNTLFLMAIHKEAAVAPFAATPRPRNSRTIIFMIVVGLVVITAIATHRRFTLASSTIVSASTASSPRTRSPVSRHVPTANATATRADRATRRGERATTEQPESLAHVAANASEAALTAQPAPTIPWAVKHSLEQHVWAAAVVRAVEAAFADLNSPDVVPVMIIPLFHESAELDSLLKSIDAPVRLFAFSWNSNNPEIAKRLDVLKRLPFGVSVTQDPDNGGFSNAVNRGIRAGEANAKELGRDPKHDWYFVVNADTFFPQGSLAAFARQVNEVKYSHGLVYGPKQDHFAFAITRRAVDTVGYFDEVFFPGYMEDIDYHWRVRIAGLPQLITRVQFIHRGGGSSNLRKGLGDYERMLQNGGRGWEYGWMKWGWYGPQHIENSGPPSGWKHPFNIPEANLTFWVVDPEHRKCVRTGTGRRHVRSTTCWYNGAVMLPHLPQGTTLSENLMQPGVSGGELR
jgi:hypothetical protein